MPQFGRYRRPDCIPDPWKWNADFHDFHDLLW